MRNYVCSSLLIIATLAILSSCTRSEEHKASTVSLQLPSAAEFKASAADVKAQGGSWGLTDPSSIDEIGCYGVFVGAAEPNLSMYSCTSNRTDYPSFKFGKIYGLYPAGASIVLDVQPGPQRSFYVLGMKKGSAACENITNSSNPDISQSNYSVPLLLGVKTQDIKPDADVVNINVALTSSTQQKITDCIFGGGSNSNTANFGTGLDGDVNWTTPTNLATQVLTNGRKASASNFVTQITALGNNDYQINLGNAWSSSEIAATDEIYVYVSAEGSATGCGTNSSNKVFAGFLTTGRVANLSSSTVLIVNGIDSRFSLATNANLTTAPVSGNSFCHMIIGRVPNFRIMTLSGSANISNNAFDFATNTGGLVFFRVSDTLQVNSTTTISAAGAGYMSRPTIYCAGDSYTGKDGCSAFGTANSSGGGSGSNGTGFGAGGAGGGAGGDSSGSSNKGFGGLPFGDTYGCGDSAFDASMQCLFGKIFFGGAGGASSSNAGGSGGGIISLFAKKIQITAGTLVIDAAGLNGANGGAGAGGSQLIRIGSLDNAGTLSINAAGGNSTGNGGGGGGGRIHLDIESCTTTGTISASVLGGTASPGVSGGVGTKYSSGSKSGCSLPF